MRVKDPEGLWWSGTRAFQKRMIENALRAVGGDKARAANALGLSRHYLVKKMRDFGIDAKDFAQEPA